MPDPKAPTQVKLKDSVFLTIEDARDWCKVPAEKIDSALDNRFARLLNMVTDLCEQYIDGPIKIRQFVEYRDGDSSNTIVPAYYPIREVSDLRIDFNRAFPESTKIDPANYFLRGIQDLDGRFKGRDIVLRDDNNTSIVGRIFTGSVAGAIKITYKAGQGDDQDSISADLVSAVLMGVEYFYKLRDNSELGVKSKTNNNQGYSRESGLPPEVTNILDDYKDYTLGTNNTPQKNTFVI